MRWHDPILINFRRVGKRKEMKRTLINEEMDKDQYQR